MGRCALPSATGKYIAWCSLAAVAAAVVAAKMQSYTLQTVGTQLFVSNLDFCSVWKRSAVSVFHGSILIVCLLPGALCLVQGLAGGERLAVPVGLAGGERSGRTVA